jgi:threonine dehydrogenase-like Zn-dependent dehydrogenase
VSIRLGDDLRIILLGRHPDGIALAREFGATDVVRARGAEAVEHVLQLTGGPGAHSVLECVGLGQAMQTSVEITRPGGAIGRVGVPQDAGMPGSQPAFYHNETIGCRRIESSVDSARAAMSRWVPNKASQTC